jgi:hypothetical protein
VWSGLIYNSLTPELNLILVLVLAVLVIELTKKYYSSRTKELRLLYIVSTFLVFNFSLSLCVAWVENSSLFYIEDNGFSWIIVLPLTFMLCIIWVLYSTELKISTANN